MSFSTYSEAKTFLHVN